jgi:hypothetical protein
LILKVSEAGERSVFPAASTARTWNVWRPKSSFDVVWGEVHDAKSDPSTEHSKVEPGSLDVNAKEGVRSLVFSCGSDVIEVFGAVVSPGAGAGPGPGPGPGWPPGGGPPLVAAFTVVGSFAVLLLAWGSNVVELADTVAVFVIVPA